MDRDVVAEPRLGVEGRALVRHRRVRRLPLHIRRTPRPSPKCRPPPYPCRCPCPFPSPSPRSPTRRSHHPSTESPRSPTRTTPRAPNRRSSNSPCPENARRPWPPRMSSNHPRRQPKKLVRSSCRRKPRANPVENVAHDALLADVVERVVVVAVVELQRLVARAGRVEEELAAARLRGLVARAVDDQKQPLDERKLFLQPLVGAHHLGHGFRRIRLLGH